MTDYNIAYYASPDPGENRENEQTEQIELVFDCLECA
jgi:hypothetical protein